MLAIINRYGELDHPKRCPLDEKKTLATGPRMSRKSWVKSRAKRRFRTNASPSIINIDFPPLSVNDERLSGNTIDDPTVHIILTPSPVMNSLGTHNKKRKIIIIREKFCRVTDFVYSCLQEVCLS